MIIDILTGKDDRGRYGKMRNAEIHDGLLLIMTDKNHTLVYDAEALIEVCLHTYIHTLEEKRPRYMYVCMDCLHQIKESHA